MKITVCIGSSCHIKGSRDVIEGIERLIKENDLSDKIELGGRFCMGRCQSGVCVKVEDKICSVNPSDVEEFFREEVLTRI